MPTTQVFSPLTLGSLTLRNRAVRAGCFEGLSQEGQVTDRLIAHHRDVAKGGVGLTTLSYCSVSRDGRAFGHELWMRPEIIPGLRTLTQTVHEQDAAAAIQLGHCGFFANPRVIGRRTQGASAKLCLFRLSWCKKMTPDDIAEKTADFAEAALLSREAGFDAVEVHAGHGYLLSQFLSPWTNHRRDEYGGSVENRLRFPTDVVRRIRAAVGPDYPIIVKMNQTDGMRRGLQLDEAIVIARAFEDAGASALVPSCGFTASTPLHMLRGHVPLKEMIQVQEGLLYKAGLAVFGRVVVRRYPFEPLFLLPGARRIRDAVNIPVGYIGGVTSLEHMDSLVEEGFAFVQLGRSTIRRPDFIESLRTGSVCSSDCDHCNRCIAAMSADGVRCVTEDEELDNPPMG